MKKFISLLLVVAIIFSMSLTTVAAEKNSATSSNIPYSQMQTSELSLLTGLSVAYIAELKADYATDSEFNDVISVHLDSVGLPSPKTIMSQGQWDSVAKLLKAGVILITAEAKFAGINHGHAAILYNKTTSVEALKPGTLSTDTDVSWWGDAYSSLGVYEPKDTSFMADAGAYAYGYLQGIPYAILPKRNATDKMNCASLVWQAYYSQRYNIESANSATSVLTPRQLHFSTNLRRLKLVNWTGSW